MHCGRPKPGMFANSRTANGTTQTRTAAKSRDLEKKRADVRVSELQGISVVPSLATDPKFRCPFQAFAARRGLEGNLFLLEASGQRTNALAARRDRSGCDRAREARKDFKPSSTLF
jgi:hypothetical protein